MLSILAPAKLNLTLEVLGKRPDGYHEVRSVLQTVGLCDCLRFKSGRGITFGCRMPGWSSERSLVARAVSLVQEAGRSGGVAIEVEERIPLMSGLGGDSSDAAAVLRGHNQLWGLGLSSERLLELAARLGSDVSFFIWGSTALVEGRGEVVTPLPPPAGRWVVLVLPRMPREPGKTAQLYARLKPIHFTDGHITRRLAQILMARRELKPSMLFNTFENVAFDRSPELRVYKEHLIKIGAPHVHLAGSGPTLFTLLEDRAQAEDLYTRCRSQGMEVYLAGVGADYAEP